MASRLQQRVRGAAALLSLALALPCLAVATPVRAAPEAPAAEGAEAPAPGAPEAAASDGAAAFAAAAAADDAGLDPVERLVRAFHASTPDEPLDERVERVRAEASRMGMWNAEPAARGVLLSDRLGSEAERARAAVRLAPGLPAAWGTLALASPGPSSGGALLRGLLEMDRHLDASVWWRATAWHALAWGLVLGGLLFLMASALRLAPEAAHDLSHRLPGRLPAHAWAVALACIGLAPAALGEGTIGLAAGSLLVALPWAGDRHRVVMLLAMAAVLAGAHPVTAESGRWIAALRADPSSVAIRNAEVGGLTPAQRDRLARLAPRDPAASHALALWNKRRGRLEEARHWLDQAGAAESEHPVLVTDAANVRLAEGDLEGAIELYRTAARARPDAAVYFNLAQVHGSRIELAEQEQALEAAHDVSASTVRELADLRGNGRLVVDIPWPVSDLRRRLASAADGRAVAASLRRDFGDGRAIHEPFRAAGGLTLLALVALALGRGRGTSRVCSVCHARRCDRCPPRDAGGCGACGASAGDASIVRTGVGLVRPVLLRLVPGLAGVAAGRPWVGWLAAVAAATAGAAFVLRGGVVPDPLAAGPVGEVAFVLAALLLAGVCALCTRMALRSNAS